jgi:hypothetical protein
MLGKGASKVPFLFSIGNILYEKKRRFLAAGTFTAIDTLGRSP